LGHSFDIESELQIDIASVRSTSLEVDLIDKIKIQFHITRKRGLIATGALQNKDLANFDKYFIDFCKGLIVYRELEEIELYQQIEKCVVGFRTSAPYRKTEVALNLVGQSTERLLEISDCIEELHRDEIMRELQSTDIALLRYFVAIENNIYPLYENLLRYTQIDQM